MQTALYITEAFLAVSALAGTYHFLVVRRCRVGLWLAANTCSVLILLFLTVSLLNFGPLSFALAVVILLYGVEGFSIFGWRFHPVIIIPQTMHIGMITLNILLWLQQYNALNAIGWGAGLCLGFVLRHFQCRALCMRSDTGKLARDPLIGHIFSHITRVSNCSNKGEHT